MAGLKRKLKAATLMESLIAMVIIIVCLGVGTMIYSNVLSSDKQRMKLKAILLLNKEATQVKADKNFIDGETIAGDYIVKRELTKVEQTENTYKLALIALDREGKIIGKRNELIITE